MVMNLYILFLISLPEAALNLYIILCLSGQNFRLNIKDKKNIFLYISALGLMLTSSIIFRPIAPNVIINFALHILAYTFIIIFVYKVDFSKSALCVSLTMVLYALVEHLYMPFIVVYISKGIENFYNGYHLFVLYSLPYRLIQIFIAVFLNKYSIILEIVKINKQFNKIFIVFMYTIIFLEYYFSYIFYNYFEKMSIIHQITFSIALLLMVFVTSYLIFKFIYVAMKSVITGGYKQYQELEKNSIFTFDNIYKLLKDDRRNDAINLLEKILDKSNNGKGGDNI